MRTVVQDIRHQAQATGLDNMTTPESNVEINTMSMQKCPVLFPREVILFEAMTMT